LTVIGDSKTESLFDGINSTEHQLTQWDCLEGDCTDTDFEDTTNVTLSLQ